MPVPLGGEALQYFRRVLLLLALDLGRLRVGGLARVALERLDDRGVVARRGAPFRARAARSRAASSSRSATSRRFARTAASMSAASAASSFSSLCFRTASRSPLFQGLASRRSRRFWSSISGPSLCGIQTSGRPTKRVCSMA